MQFNSAVFGIFAALFFAVWPLARRRPQVRWLTLTVASFVFYGWWDWRFLFLIAGSGILDFAIGLAIERWPRRRHSLLAVSLVGNLGSLGAFKYLTFLTVSLNDGLAALGLGSAIPIVQLTLPVGISFYTFQSMSYTIDVYRGQIRPTHSVLHFFAYLSMFPQLVAGPIVRASDLLPQLTENRPVSAHDRWIGLALVTHGYFKKVVIADNLAPVVNAAFEGRVLDNGAYWWVVVTMFAFQIYCDFSGYSDIARGLARWMGLDFRLNFAHPYGSASLREFWTRWHISLSTWFRDYVYIPLGGGRDGATRGHRNMWAVMLLSGLWHGAAWTFVCWGAVHAALLSVERATHWPERFGRHPATRALALAIVTVQVWVAWVFFRADTLAQALAVLREMFTPASFDAAALADIAPMAWIALGIGVARECYFILGIDRSPWAQSRLHEWLEPVGVGGMIAACVFLQGPGGAFIYFQF